jgi:hypothetical protein
MTTDDSSLKITPAATEAEKLRLIGLLEAELKIHGLVDATGYINDNTIINKSHTHSGFVRSVAFKMEKMGTVEVIPVEDWKRFYIKELTWDKKHPFFHAMRISFANSIFYIIGGVLVAIIVSRLTQSKVEVRLDSQKIEIQSLRDSVTNLQQRIKEVEQTTMRPDSLNH